MKQRTQKYLHAILALVLSLCLITGCSLFPNSAPKADKNTSQETIAEEATENSSDDSASQPDEAALAAAREAFDQYTENLFKQEASQSLLTLHYTLADPESYGITDYDRTLGTASAEDTRKDLEEAKQIKADLEAMDTRLLSKDQLLTYTILSSYINTLLSSDGLELYDQPLSTTLGIQSQLPILLSEYTFYKKQDIDDYRESPALRVIDELASLRSRRSDAHSENYVVKTSFEEGEHIFARDPFHSVRHFVIFMKLTFLNAVDTLRLLLLTKLQAVFRNLLSARTVLTGSHRTLIERAFLHIAFIAFEEELCAFPSAKFAFCFSVYSHNFLIAS